MLKRSESFNDWMLKLFPEFSNMAKTVTFQVTDKCNLACTYCYQINKGVRRMSFETAKKLVDALLEDDPKLNNYVTLEDSPALILEFIGGEPFLEVDLIDKIVDYFRMRAIELNHPWGTRFAISFSSNGTLYFDEKVQNFIQKNFDIISLSITVDGTKELHDKCRVFPDGSPSYYLAHTAANDWMSRGYRMGTKITLSPDNVMYINECLQSIMADGHNEIFMNTVFEDVWSAKDCTIIYDECKRFTEWFKENHDPDDFYCSFFEPICGQPMCVTDDQNWCGGVGQMLAMDPDGFLYPCIRYMESSVGNKVVPYRIGHIDYGIFQRPDECERKDCMECVGRRSQSTDECFYCPIASQCAWCSAYNYQMTGTVNKRMTASCQAHKARALATVFFWNSMHMLRPSIPALDLWCPEDWALEIISKEDYDELVSLTKQCGKFVNSNNLKHIEMQYLYPTYFSAEDIVKETERILNNEATTDST